MKKRTLIFMFCLTLVLVLMLPGAYVAGEAIAGSVDAKDAKHLYYAIAIVMGVTSLAGGYAVAKVGSAAMGAVAEKPELVWRAIAYVGLAEGIAIYGLIVALLLYAKL